MIRINLLGAPKPKSKRGGSAAAAVSAMEVGDAGSPLLKVAVVLLLCAGFNFYRWHQLESEKQEIAVKMQQAEQKNGELADVKARYLERQRQAESYKRCVY